MSRANNALNRRRKRNKRAPQTLLTGESKHISIDDGVSGKSSALSTQLRNVVSAVESDTPHDNAIVEAFRDRFEREGFAFEPGDRVREVATPAMKRWADEARLAGQRAPQDRNPGGPESGRHRFYSIGTYVRRAAVGARFSPIAPYEDRSGELFTTYIQPPGVNRDYAAERRFDPLPDALLSHPGLQGWIDMCFQSYPSSLFPGEARDLLKVGSHLIAMTAEGIRPGISSPNRAHVDGEFVTTILLLERVGVIGGTNLVVERSYTDTHPNQVPFEARLADLTLEGSLDMLAVDDRRLAHYVSPVFARKNRRGWRTVLLVDFTPLQPVTSDERLAVE